jgi:predicted anti-sigma-YlaC factor YlaD
MNRHAMICSEMVELATARLDEALHARMRAVVDYHLLHCRGCRNYLEQLRITVHVVGRIGAEPLDAAYRNRLLDAFSAVR